ncbi:MAG: thiosulfate oxidation carrier protein SoxY [Gemmatimonadales bacterium]
MSTDPRSNRRAFLQSVGLVGAALALEGLTGRPRSLAAWPASGPDDPEIPNEQVARIMKERFGDRPIQRGHVTLDMPPVAEDGRFVPVAIEADLPMTADEYVKGVYLIVDHNPDPLVMVLHFTATIGPVDVETRIKMRRTCWIRAICETSTGELWADYAKVETSLNGCG